MPTVDVVALEKFPYNYFDVVDPGVDLEQWTLAVDGAVARPGHYRLDQITSLPVVRQNTRHVCVEGWDVIGRLAVRGWRFPRSRRRRSDRQVRDRHLRRSLLRIARHADSAAPTVAALYEMVRQPLDRGHGAPLRLQIPTTLGYKQAKYLTTLTVAHVLPAKRSYWGDEGYSWYGGL